ncbi:MAG: hypothetical protein NTW96_25505 [Planctomycetia bacterium]|nr:hypothetical protein [Planctomycetia bacterium]
MRKADEKNGKATATVDDDIRSEFAGLIEAAQRVSKDVADEVQRIFDEGRDRVLDRHEAARLLTRVITVLQRGMKKRGDKKGGKTLGGQTTRLVEQIVCARDRMLPGARPSAPALKKRKAVLVGRGNVKPGPVFPRPVFHGREVAMSFGFIKTADIDLWSQNERLDIHLGQFEKLHGRTPTSAELLEIMLSKMQLPGIEDGDQFKISELARSVAVNGVRKPPILDTDGTLLDGNRRVAACHFVLNSDEFDADQKRRAEYVYVWQLTEHATPDDRDAVVVSLNFESDCKQDWPEYVKARKVYEEWQAMLALEPRAGSSRQLEMRRALSKKFALGPDTSVVSRYLKMVEWTIDFEEYHINEKKRDTYEVKHRANKYFQYFDELAKGERSGVANVLKNDDNYRHLVFDLLFQGKFKNWRQIRDLKFTYENEEAVDQLREARETPDTEKAEECIDNAISIARTKRADNRSLGANSRIEVFVKWLEELPVKAFRDQIKAENLRRLLKALKLVERQAKTVLQGEDDDG